MQPFKALIKIMAPYWAETNSQDTAKSDIRCLVAKHENLGKQIIVTKVWAIRLHGTPKADGPKHRGRFLGSGVHGVRHLDFFNSLFRQ